MQDSRPQYENLQLGKKTFRVIQINNGDQNKQASDQQASLVYNNWRSSQESQKMIENEIQRKKNLTKHKNESSSQWDSQWEGGARPMNALELAAVIDTGDFSHFVSIPLYKDDKFIKKLNSLKNKVEETFGSKYSSNILRDFRTAHITLLMLKLNTPERQKKAIECMKNCEDVLRVLQGKINKFNIKGLGYFGKSEKQATTVYANIDDVEFTNFCNEATNIIIKEFIDFQLLNEDDLSHIKKDAEGKYTPQKLHISLFKAPHQKQQSAGFDSIDLLDSFQDFEFKGTKLHMIDISTRGEYSEKNGNYVPLHSFSIYEN